MAKEIAGARRSPQFNGLPPGVKKRSLDGAANANNAKRYP